MTERRPRLLFTDYIWPTAIAKWRLTEIFELIRFFDVDFYVPHRPSGFPTHLAVLEKKFPLSSYDCITFESIYDTAYDLNSINSMESMEDAAAAAAGVQNTKPACAVKRGYLLRLRKYRNDKEILDSCAHYDVIYHMFYDTFVLFRTYCPSVSLRKQCLHLYPTGMLQPKALETARFDGCGALIVTQDAVRRRLRLNGCKTFYYSGPDSDQRILNDAYSDTTIVCELIGAPYLGSTSTLVKKQPRASDLCELHVSFTTIGRADEKGDFVFCDVVRSYSLLYPNDRVVFHAIGSVAETLPASVVRMGIMSQFDLDDFYHREIDVHINCQTGLSIHGWPLGAEAMLAGCLLMTTDYTDENSANGFHFSDSDMVRYGGEPSKAAAFFAAKLHEFYLDRARLAAIAESGQSKAHQLFSYDRMIAPAIQCLRSVAERSGFGAQRNQHQFAAFDISRDDPGYPHAGHLGGFQLSSSTIGVQWPTQVSDRTRTYLSSLLIDRAKQASAATQMYVEIGCMAGATALHCFEKTASSCQIVAIDPFDSIDTFNGLSANATPPDVVVNTRTFLRSCYCRLVAKVATIDEKTRRFRVIRNTAFGALEEFSDASIDLLFVDGDHSTRSVYDDVRYYFAKIKAGGSVVISCADWPPIQRAVDRLHKTLKPTRVAEKVVLSCGSKFFKFVK